jgi:hypothetical protein
MFDNIIYASKTMVMAAIMVFFGQLCMNNKRLISEQKIIINNLNESQDIANYEYEQNIKFQKKKNCIMKERHGILYKKLCHIYKNSNRCIYGVSIPMIEKRFDMLLVNIQELITEIEERSYTGYSIN